MAMYDVRSAMTDTAGRVSLAAHSSSCFYLELELGSYVRCSRTYVHVCVVSCHHAERNRTEH